MGRGRNTSASAKNVIHFSQIMIDSSVEYPLCSRPCARCLGHIREQKRQKSPPSSAGRGPGNAGDPRAGSVSLGLAVTGLACHVAIWHSFRCVVPGPKGAPSVLRGPSPWAGHTGGIAAGLGTGRSGRPEQAGAPGAHSGGTRPGWERSAGQRSREMEQEPGRRGAGWRKVKRREGLGAGV